MAVVQGIAVGALVTESVIETIRSLTTGSGSHTRKIGMPTQLDKVLYKEEIRRGSVTMGYATYTVTLGPKALNGKKITAIVIQDMWSDDTGGDAEIKGGGVGYDSVTIEICSKFYRGFNFHISVFGR